MPGCRSGRVARRGVDGRRIGATIETDQKHTSERAGRGIDAGRLFWPADPDDPGREAIPGGRGPFVDRYGNGFLE